MLSRQDLKKHQQNGWGVFCLFNVFFVEKKLKRECLVGGLICSPVWDACYLHRIGDDDPDFGKNIRLENA